MKFMKSTALALALITSPLTSHAGIPVVDAVSNLEQVNEWTQHLEQWQSTVQHYRSQLDAYKSQLATATGIRDIQGFFNEAKSLTSDLKNLQKNGISLNDLLTNSGSYSSELNGLYSKYKSFDNCISTNSQSYADICKQQVLNKAVAIENTTEVQNKLNSTMSDIASLSSRIEASPDSKESQDLANVIAAKSVQLNALTSQWEMETKMAEQREKMLDKQKDNAWKNQQLNAPIPDFNTWLQ